MKLTFPDLSQLWSQVRALAPAAILAVEEVLGPGTGEEKRSRAVVMLRALVDPALPDMLNPFIDLGIGWIIDGLVARLNREGLLPKRGEEIPEPAAVTAANASYEAAGVAREAYVALRGGRPESPR